MTVLLVEISLINQKKHFIIFVTTLTSDYNCITRTRYVN